MIPTDVTKNAAVISPGLWVVCGAVLESLPLNRFEATMQEIVIDSLALLIYFSDAASTRCTPR